MHQPKARDKIPNVTVGSGKSTNPKIEALLDAIINDTPSINKVEALLREKNLF